MQTRIDTPCPKCGEQTLEAKIESAAHDQALLDIVIECSTDDGGCGVVLNAFLPLADMQEVE